MEKKKGKRGKKGRKQSNKGNETILDWKHYLLRATNHIDTLAQLHCQSTYHFWLIIFENSYRTFCCNLGHDDDGKRYSVKKVKIYCGSSDNTSGLLALAGAAEWGGGRSSAFLILFLLLLHPSELSVSSAEQPKAFQRQHFKLSLKYQLLTKIAMPHSDSSAYFF